MTPALNDIRLYVYRRFSDDAVAATPADVAGAFGLTGRAARDALRALHDAHLLVLGPGGEQIVMAHPWAAVPLGFVVSSSMQKWWDDVVSTCNRQRLFCHPGHLADWLARTGTERGAVLGLDQLWELAAGWYAGRLTAGYRRRTPDEAAEYFKSIGLTGEFWRTQ